jgi:hypothetical protein
MRILTLGATLLIVLGCAGLGGVEKGEGEEEEAPGIFEDQDGDDDGYVFDDDCDDDNAAVHPGAVELCDAADVDEDCNGVADNADAGVQGGYIFFHDADADGFGDPQEAVSACEQTTGYVVIDGDCDDADPAVNPAAIEICDDADVDEDCNDLADDADPWVDPTGMSAWHEDRDGDSFGDPDLEDEFCDRPDGWVERAQDCDDLDENVNPDAVEVCDGIDDDCDGYADDADAVGVATWYADDDDDGYGDAADTREACEQPDGFTDNADDCDDGRGNTYPGAAETCDGEDDDCDGSVDESDARDADTWYRDSDRDGYGDPDATTPACDQPAGYVSVDGDCDDATAAVSPADTELCDDADVDEDCDGLADDDDASTLATGKTTAYYDADGDSYGNADISRARCDIDDDFVTNDDDCDDDDADVNPGETEICDAADTDEDCDDVADDDDGSVAAAGLSTWYLDADGDGYGVTTTTLSACDEPSGYSDVSTDCDDTNAARDPGNTEVCDAANLDEDCDLVADDSDASVLSSSKIAYYPDGDADGYGDSGGVGSTRCDQPAGYAAGRTDCDDDDAMVSPGDAELCFDGIDNDCSGADSCTFTADSADRQLIGEEASDAVGSYNQVAWAGDTDNDGYDDLVVGAPGNDRGGSSSGAAYIVRGGVAGDLDLSASIVLTGEDSSDSAGIAVAGLGDMNLDGKDDVIVGATGDDEGGSNAGKVYFVRGGGASLDLSSATGRLIGENASDAAGCAVAGPGDVSGDGKPDLLVGAYGRSSSAGAAYLISSQPTATDLSASTAILTGESSSDYAGYALDGAGDLNGDGVADFVVGAYGDDDVASAAGAVYVFLGPVTGSASLSSADAKVRGAGSSHNFGKTVGGGGDQNGDGYDDFLATSPEYGYGTVYLMNGPITGTATVTTVVDATLTTASSEDLGDALDIGGDIDGDGIGDVLVGAPSASGGGRSYMLLGPLSGAVTVSTAYDGYFSGTTSNDYFGRAVAFAGDHDGDGLDDFAVGSAGEDDGGSAAGSAWLIAGGGL